MSEESAPNLAPVTLSDGRQVIGYESGNPGAYRVVMPGGEVQAFPATAEATADTAEADIVTAPPPLSVAYLKAAATARRYEIETGGITLGAVTLATDRQSQALINGALALAARAPGWTTQWKGSDNTWSTIDAATIGAIADAVGAHVQACFAREAELHAAIAAASRATLRTMPATIAAFWA